MKTSQVDMIATAVWTDEAGVEMDMVSVQVMAEAVAAITGETEGGSDQ